MYDWLIFVYVKRVTSPTLLGSVLILDSSFYHPLTRNFFLQEISKALGWTPKVVDSCLRENGVLCTVARSWLLFLHDESEWKNFESNIAWGVDELHQTFWLEQFSNGKLCCKIQDLLSVPITFFWIGLLSAQCSVLSGRFCVCFRCPEKWSRGVVCVWPRTNSDTIVSMIIWVCYLEWMIYGGELIWCDLPTSKICQVEETVLVSVRIFVNKININRCKRWYYGPRAKLSIFFWMLRVSMVSSHLDLQLLLLPWYNLYRHHTNQLARKDYMKAWNNIKNDFDQETGQEYSTIVQVIVKADRGKAIAWRSVSCKMTCYHIPDEKIL